LLSSVEYIQDFAARYTAAWCSQDPARVASFFSALGSLTINGGTPCVGRDAIAAAARSFMVAFPDLRVSMDDVLVREEEVEYHWTLIGTNTGPGGTGNSVRITGYEAWQVGDDGLIAKSRGHFDALEYQRQLDQGARSRD
jgi:uncharacterized protein (TIGR02246 family)